MKLTDCVDTVEEEQKEGMKEERDHDHEDGQDQIPMMRSHIPSMRLMSMYGLHL